jgi:hypothetical protein
LEQLEIRKGVGLLIDDDVLRELVVAQLVKEGRTHLLRGRGGIHTFGDGWCARFWRRHNQSSRVAGTKMREDMPDDFDKKKDVYITVGAYLINKYNIPPELWINCDETNALFVTMARKTRATKGSKRIRLIGIGKDKAQITCTLAVAGDGQVLPYQLIFGGTTVRCHPTSGEVVTGSIVTHTKSHWQIVETYIHLIETVYVPWKNDRIRSLGLPPDQWVLLKHDLHYTHKDPRVLAVLMPRLTMGALKPQMISFVNKGYKAIATPAMKAAIAKSFQEDGLFAEMVSSERVAVAAATLASERSAAEDEESRRHVAELQSLLDSMAVGEEMDNEEADKDDIAQGQCEGVPEVEVEDDASDDDDNDSDGVAVTAPAVNVTAPVNVSAAAGATVTVNAPVTVTAPVTMNVAAALPAVLTRAVVMKMKVSELRNTLTARGLNSSGSKAEMMLRLVDVLSL